jgi:hypothetical protein
MPIEASCAISIGDACESIWRSWRANMQQKIELKMGRAFTLSDFQLPEAGI